MVHPINVLPSFFYLQFCIFISVLTFMVLDMLIHPLMCLHFASFRMGVNLGAFSKVFILHFLKVVLQVDIFE